MSRTARRDDKVASGVVVYLMEELGDARLRAAQLKQYVAKALELVEGSEHRDHFFEVAADLIHGIPDTMFKLDKALDAAAMAAARMDYEEIKQGLKPEKAEELERVLEDVRLHYLKRRSSQMNAKEAARTLEMFAKVTKARGAVPTADLARFVARIDRGSRTASRKNPAVFFREAAEYLRTTESPDTGTIVASLRRVLADALVADELLEAGAGDEFKKVNPGISEDDVETINEMHEKNKNVVKDKTAAYGDPYWMTAKYPGKDKDGKPFKKGDKVFYYPRTKTILTGDAAEKASREFDAAAFDEDYGFRAASISRQAAYGVALMDTLEDVEKDVVSLKRPVAEVVKAIDAIYDDLMGHDKLKAAAGKLSAAVSALDSAYGKTSKALDEVQKIISKGDEDDEPGKTASLVGSNPFMADDIEAEGLDDACWEGYEAYGLKPGEGGGMVPNCVPVKTAKVKVQDGLKVKAKGAFAKGLKDGTVYTLQKAAPHGGEDTYSFVAKGKVVARFPESAVERFLENGESGDSNGLVKTAKVKVQDGLKVKAKGTFAKGLKDGTVYTLQKAAPHGGEDTYSFVAKDKVVARFPESAVERFLENGESGDSNGLVKMAASEPVAEEWKAARFEKGVPADPTENMSEEDAAEWKAMTEEHGDKFKTASKPKFQPGDKVEDENGKIWKIESKGLYDDFLKQHKYQAKPESGGMRLWINEEGRKLVKSASTDPWKA